MSIEKTIDFTQEFISNTWIKRKNYSIGSEIITIQGRKYDYSEKYGASDSS